MTLMNISLASYIVGKLRNNNIRDYNTNRSSQFGQWIYADSPKISKLLNSSGNFPRISVETMSNATLDDIGMSCLAQTESTSLKINIWTVRDLVLTVNDTSAEEHAYLTSTTKYELTNLPASIISLVTGTLSGVPGHTFTNGTDYRLMDNDADGFNDSIEWLTNDLPDNGTTIYVSYQRKASADELCRIIAQDINKYLRENWRLWTERAVWSYKKTGATPVPFDNDLGIFRFELIVSFEGINSGDSI